VKKEKMAEEGLSIQKVARDLRIPTERVQYYWNNWMNKNNYIPNPSPDHAKIQKEITSQSKSLANGFQQLHGEMLAKLVSPRKAIFLWDSSDLPIQLFQRYFQMKFDELVQLIRIYDVTQLQFNGKNATHFFDIPIRYCQGYWFVKGLFANRCYLAEIGVKLPDGDFFPFLRSNSIEIPHSEMINNDDLYHEAFQLNVADKQQPKWREYVSTYSYYDETEE
jgi:hypothetical protein